MSIVSDRVKSTCALCGETDTHPKHYPHERPHHLDCGRLLDCTTCDVMLRASGEQHGDDLTKFMESRVALPSGV